LVWFVIILGFGLEGCAHLFNQDYWTAAFAFGGMVVLTGLAIHWARLKTTATGLNTRWLAASCLVIIMSLALSPFVEQRKWPFAAALAGFGQRPASATEIAAALEPMIAAKLDARRQAPASADDQPPPDVFSLIKSLRANLDSTNHTLQFTQQQLATAQRELDDARRPPLDPKEIPTWLDLVFDASGRPAETKSTNVHWAYWSGVEPATCPYSAGTSAGLLTLTQPPSCNSDNTLIFLSFDKPITYQDIYLRASAPLPQWDVHRKEAKSAIIIVHGKITSSPVSIEVIK
jgi:hypothetical protein